MTYTINGSFLRNPQVEERFPNFYPFLEKIIQTEHERLAEAVANASAQASKRPRRVWLYWGQGWDSAPPVCQLCRESWQGLNREFQVEAIDEGTFDGLLDGLSLGRELYHPRIKANVLRLRLLLNFGGVWADPTIFCARPIESWLPFCSSDSSLFLFSFRRGGDRRIANWFIKGDGSSCLLALWSALYEAYLEALIKHRTGLHAYFAQHYIFDVARQLSPEAAREWERMPRLSPGAAGGSIGSIIEAPGEVAAPLADSEQRRIARLLNEIPIHKLSWKGRVSSGAERTERILDELRAFAARSQPRPQ